MGLKLKAGGWEFLHKNAELEQKIQEAQDELKDQKPGGGPESREIPRSQDIPQLEALLEEYKDVFPADLPAEPPPEREFSMRIPIKEGSQPTHRVSRQTHDLLPSLAPTLLACQDA